MTDTNPHKKIKYSFVTSPTLSPVEVAFYPLCLVVAAWRHSPIYRVFRIPEPHTAVMSRRKFDEMSEYGKSDS